MSYLLLEDGTRFDGDPCGAPVTAVGEVVFNTSMSGYQEAVTDPSYAGQLLIFTYPHIGNYGVRADAMESDRIHARGVIMRAARNSRPIGGESGWLDGSSRTRSPRSPISTRARSCATSASRARCAAGSSRRSSARTRRAP